MSPYVGSGLVNAHELLKHILRNGFGIKNPEKFWSDPMSMMPPPGVPGEGGLPPEQGGDPLAAGSLPVDGPLAMDPQMLLELQNAPV
jgi:hypothetical protein